MADAFNTPPTRTAQRASNPPGQSIHKSCPRRLFDSRRSTFQSHSHPRSSSSKPRHTDPIYAVHEENQRLRSVNALTPSTPGSTYKAIFAAGLPATRTLRNIQQDQQALLRSFNSARWLEGSEPLRLDEGMSGRLVNYVDVTEGGHAHKAALRWSKPAPGFQATKITRVEPYRSQGKAVRLVSPPGLGALACAEMWCAGKYSLHVTRSSPSAYPQRQASTPWTQQTSQRRRSGTGKRPVRCPEACPCHLREVWKVIVQARWRVLGVGRSEGGSEGGRWVVELAEGVGNDKYARAARILPDLRRPSPRTTIASPESQGYSVVKRESSGANTTVDVTPAKSTREVVLKSPTSARSLQHQCKRQRQSELRAKSSTKALPPLPPEAHVPPTSTPPPQEQEEEEEDLLSFSPCPSPVREEDGSSVYSSSIREEALEGHHLQSSTPSPSSSWGSFQEAAGGSSWKVVPLACESSEVCFEEEQEEEYSPGLKPLPLRIMRRSQLRRLREREEEGREGVWV